MTREVPRCASAGAKLLAEMELAAARHEREWAVPVRAFIAATEERLTTELDGYVRIYTGSPLYSPGLEAVLGAARDCLVWMRWVGWNIATLGPLVCRDPAAGATRLALLLLAYIPGRLVDDALDDHADFKGYRATLVGEIRRAHPDSAHHVACVISAQIGFAVFHHALRRLRECGMEAAAAEVGRLFDAATVGVLAECFVPLEVDPETYYRIVGRKQVAYNMILYRVFLADLPADLRVPLLRACAALDEIAQLLNDVRDASEDRAAGRLNALTHGVLEPATATAAVGVRLAELWELSSPLPRGYRDAVAAMCRNLAPRALKPLPR